MPDLIEAAAAARAGELETLQRLVREDPALLSARDESGDTLLGLACRAATVDVAIPARDGTPEQHAVLDWLLAAGADPNAATAQGWAPLHTAAMAGHVSLASRLLAAGARREGRLHGASGGSPLSLGLFYAKREVAELLAHPAVPDNLRTAAALGRPIARFVSQGGELTAAAAEGTDFYRPLLLFPEWRRTNSRQELLDEALCWAARNGRLEAMADLVALGADVNANPYRGTPLLWAIYADAVDAAQWLLDQGADPDRRHDFGGKDHGRAAVAMHLAAQYECLKCLGLLLDRGADPNVRDGSFDATPLGWARHENAPRAVALLEARGAG